MQIKGLIFRFSTFCFCLFIKCWKKKREEKEKKSGLKFREETKEKNKVKKTVKDNAFFKE